MANDEVQKNLLAETKSTEQALDYAVRREKGLENPLQKTGNFRQPKRIYEHKIGTTQLCTKKGLLQVSTAGRK